MIDDLVTENAELQQQLTRKEAELTRAEETIRREQQQVRQLEHVGTCKGTPLGFLHYVEVDVLVCTVVKTSLSFPVQEVAELQQQLRMKEAELTRAEETIRREQQQMRQQVSDCVATCSVCCD